MVLQTLAHAACPNVSEGLRHRLLKTAYHEVMLPASKKVAICDGYECSTVRSSVHVASEIVTYEYGTLTVSVLSVSAINVDPRVADLTVCESLKCSLRQIVWCVNTGVQISQRISEYGVQRCDCEQQRSTCFILTAICSLTAVVSGSAVNVQ